MSNISTENYVVRIVPGKIHSAKKSSSEAVKQVFNELHTSYFLNKSELKSRIFGKSFGIFTLAIDPIFQAITYFFLTAYIFRGAIETSFLSLYVTVVFWQLFSKPLLNAGSALGANSGIIKQTNFPLRIVFFSFFSLEFILWFISFGVLLGFLLLNGVLPNARWVLIPVLILIQFAMTAALSFPVAILGAYFKDITSVLAPLLGIWFYLSPGIYNREKVPEAFRWIYDLNPFSSLFEAYRYIFFEKGELFPISLVLIFIISIIALLVQANVFRLLLRRLYSYI
ncbi:ABC transporter permease [Bdellovibrio sp. HCB-110]|uniref:ABC transporter permease n=1 Tax=Bdellovibrio sp. HCB-110 TaxID=3391182 RepID=UPI0039B52DC2